MPTNPVDCWPPDYALGCTEFIGPMFLVSAPTQILLCSSNCTDPARGPGTYTYMFINRSRLCCTGCTSYDVGVWPANLACKYDDNTEYLAIARVCGCAWMGDGAPDKSSYLQRSISHFSDRTTGSTYLQLLLLLLSLLLCKWIAFSFTVATTTFAHILNAVSYGPSFAQSRKRTTNLRRGQFEGGNEATNRYHHV